MSCLNDPRALNLRRWEESGLPRRWVETRQGAWGHADWLLLLQALRQSDYWPLDAEAVGRSLEEWKKRVDNLRRWEQSGQPRQWIAAHRGRWDVEDWLALLEELHASEFWPLHADSARGVLERLTREWWNLRRWQQSGQPWQWIEAHQGCWTNTDWQALISTLRQSDYWPLDSGAVAGLLRTLNREWWNLRRWQQSGLLRQWLESRQGQWNADDLFDLLMELRTSEFWPLAPATVQRLLEEATLQWWNLRRWLQSGQARQWVEARHGQWGRGDWLTLLAELEKSEFWPLAPEAVEDALHRLARQGNNLGCWVQSGSPRRWVELQQGRWRHNDWLALLAELRQSEHWPVSPAAVGMALEEARVRWSNLQRWQESDQPRRWIEARRGQWTEGDFLALLDELERSGFWPLDTHAVEELLTELRDEWEVVRRWQQGGSSRTAAGGQGTFTDLVRGARGFPGVAERAVHAAAALTRAASGSTPPSGSGAAA
jgi:hypothetical protein